MNKQSILALPLFLLATASAREDPQPAPQQAQQPAPQKETGQRLAELELAMVPVGGVILWWGSASDLPEGYEVCDGTVPFHRNALLKDRKPDLRDRFVKCAKDISGYRSHSAIEGGSNDTGVRRTASHPLTTDEIPAHQHSIAHVHQLPTHTHSVPGHSHTLPDHQHRIEVSVTTAQSGSDLQVLHPDPNGQESTQPGGAGNTGTLREGVTGSGGGGQTLGAGPDLSGFNKTQGAGHIHEIPSYDNRPAFLEMLYIIRVM